MKIISFAFQNVVLRDEKVIKYGEIFAIHEFISIINNCYISAKWDLSVLISASFIQWDLWRVNYNVKSEK